jgi:AbrB family looped-hinge helix DNA binding protein
VSETISVKVSSRYQVAVPRIAREKLNIQSGDRLLVDVQDGILILVPQPQDYVAYMAGLHREIWTGMDVDAYLNEEREAWSDSTNKVGVVPVTPLRRRVTPPSSEAPRNVRRPPARP